MTHRPDVAHGRAVAARWCALAEQRLEHLTELFETGRWRRYHSELAFLENIQEAKRAVQTWRALAAGEALPVPSGPPSLGWSPAPLAPSARPTNPQIVQPKGVHIEPETAVAVELDSMAHRLAEISDIQPVSSIEVQQAPDNPSEFTLSLDGIEAKYPLLRNAFHKETAAAQRTSARI